MSSDLHPLPGNDHVHLPRLLLADLPETPFWEYDVVETYKGRIGTISSIDMAGWQIRLPTARSSGPLREPH
ncbi:MAG: hypothetical protein DI528_18560 [Shinella sp.]|nr:MAG: hypothetical protein DI528_18560 [Shinella sp.]